MTNNPILSLFSPTIRFPGCGDVDMGYSPYTKWEAPSLYRGDDRVELRTYTEVASAGKQLGKLTEVVLKLAEVNGLDMPEVDQLKAYQEQIEGIKQSIAGRSEQQFEELADKLATQNPKLLRCALEKYQAKLAEAVDE